MALFSHSAQSAPTRIRAILIVEDEPLLAFDNEHALAQAGYRVVNTVDRYEHAVKAMEEETVDLVIADIRLRGVQTGVDVARLASERAIPVLFSTALCPPDAEPFAMGWLAKPYDARDLVRAIKVIDAVLAGRKPRLRPDAMTLFSATPRV